MQFWTHPHYSKSNPRTHQWVTTNCDEATAEMHTEQYTDVLYNQSENMFNYITYILSWSISK
jgi:hypothetical protein